jgi:hypothetical protein
VIVGNRTVQILNTGFDILPARRILRIDLLFSILHTAMACDNIADTFAIVTSSVTPFKTIGIFSLGENRELISSDIILVPVFDPSSIAPRTLLRGGTFNEGPHFISIPEAEIGHFLYPFSVLNTEACYHLGRIDLLFSAYCTEPN